MYAKTLYKPVRPDWANDIITKYTKAKVPSFFMYAKKKKKKQVEQISECVVDRIIKLYPTKKLNFNFKQSNIGKFDYRMLMSNSNVIINDEIVLRYKWAALNMRNFNNITIDNMCNYYAMYEKIKEFIIADDDIELVVDNIILELFVKHKTAKKKIFWMIFGDIVYNNLSKNLNDNLIQCKKCHKRFYQENIEQIYCDKCQKHIQKNIKQKKKILTCVDCGKEFEVDARNMKKIRCDECQKEYRKKWDRERKRL